jgi:hypothetical protein
MKVNAALHFIRMLWGFFAALFVTAILGYVICELLTLTYEPVHLSDIDLRYFNSETILAFTATVFLTSCVFAAPLWILMVFVTETLDIRSRTAPILAGIGTVGLILFDANLGPFEYIYEGSRVSAGRLAGPFFWIIAVGIGTAGGLVYWLAAGCHSGAWKASK